MHKNSRLLFTKFALPLFQPGLKVLEIGPDGFPSTYQKSVTIENITWHTLDVYDSPRLTYPGAGLYSFPIPDGSYDIVLSDQVIAHVAKIWRWMPELARITKPGGVVVTIAPSSWPYHEAPIDCWRFYPAALRALCEDSGLLVENTFWGTLELPYFSRALPGRSLGHCSAVHRTVFLLLGLLGFPIEKAFDTICIARRPASSETGPSR